MNENSIDAAKQQVRKVERRLATGWVKFDSIGVQPVEWKTVDGRWRCTSHVHLGDGVLASHGKRGQNGGNPGACLACAESMGVYESLAAAETTAERGRAALSPAETASAKAEVGASTPAAATCSCPCARMNLRDLSGDSVCYCTERPKREVRAVGEYLDNDTSGCREGFGYYDGWAKEQAGVATGLHMEARHKTATEIACERASRRYPSTCDNEPSGA